MTIIKTAESDIGGFNIRIVRCMTEEQIARVYAIRHAVFCDEQGYDRDSEVDRDDGDAYHFYAELPDGSGGTTRLVVRDGATVQLGRLAVEKPGRKHGLASALVRYANQFARSELHAKQVYVHSQMPVVAFYVKLDYRIDETKPQFLDEGQPHRLMYIDL